jgi:hypothetical protein
MILAASSFRFAVRSHRGDSGKTLQANKWWYHFGCNHVSDGSEYNRLNHTVGILLSTNRREIAARCSTYSPSP